MASPHTRLSAIGLSAMRRAGGFVVALFIVITSPLSAEGVASAPQVRSVTPIHGESPGTAVTPESPAAPMAMPLRLPDYFSRRFVGSIGNDRQIVVNLTRRRDQVSGDCYETGKGVPIFFSYASRVTSSGDVHLDAGEGLAGIDYGGIRGVFDGAFVTPGKIRGSWRSAAGGATAPFRLVESSGDAQDFTVVHAERGSYNGGRGSATVDVTFPIIAAERGATAPIHAIAVAFNRNERSRVLGLYDRGGRSRAPASVDGLMNRFLRRYRTELASPAWRLRPLPYPPWIYQIWSSVTMNRDNLVSLERVAFWFEGGAHPDTIYQEETYDLTAKAPISLADILRPGTAATLNAIGLVYFRREHAIPNTRSLSAAGYFVSDSSFRLNDNFMVAPGGLLFRFNQYEIGPYVMGAPEVFIPFSALKSILRARSPIAELVDGR